MPPAGFAALRPSAAAAGRTSGRPCSCAVERAALFQTNPRGGVRIHGRLGVAGSLEPALIASAGRMPKRASMERPEATRAEGSVRATGTGRPEPASPKTQGASGRQGPAAPILRHPRRRERPGDRDRPPRACGTQGAGSVRATGTGRTEPASPKTLRTSRAMASATPSLAGHSAANFVRRAFTTGAGTNFNSDSSSASGVICLSSDDEMWE